MLNLFRTRPMHAVTKDSSTTTQLHVVFDASTKSRSGALLNDELLVGAMLHVSLLDVLLRFRLHRVALTTDVSRRYRAVLLPEDQHNLHQFIWRRGPQDFLIDYRMTWLTFGMSTSSFAANVPVKQNAILHQRCYASAAPVIHMSFYVNAELTGADSIPEAIQLQKELQDMPVLGGFTLCKWTSNESGSPRHVPYLLVECQLGQELHMYQLSVSLWRSSEWNGVLNLIVFIIQPAPFPLLQCSLSECSVRANRSDA